ncbi:MAG: D-alanyl-D-alanine carboxypeptidase/D-alanyl-D-alanine-endopeptidase [Crocinitomicaceae bacterium]|nr:D-alanyl-D-alanine carboxypeptidase/D-alanyl-D-alanine-endopeptidase [Crocinitomicaceae bacterium]
MKITSSILFTLILSINFGFCQSKIQVSLDNFVNDVALNHASISCEVVDLSTKQIVAEYAPNQALPTASTAKLFSTAAALEILGENYRPKTRIYHTGEIDSLGILKGNLWIRGGGDPSLGSKYYSKQGHERDFLYAWIDSLKKRGIQNIEGNLIVDASEFGYEGVPDGWNWVDLGNYYGAGPSGLTIFDNLLKITFSTSQTAGRVSKITSMFPEVPGMQFHNYVKSSTRKGDNAYIYGAPYSMDRFVTGTLPIGRNSFIVKGSIPDPEFQFGFELLSLLKEQGIEVRGKLSTGRKLGLTSNNKSYSDKKLIYTHQGIPIGKIVNKTNEKSVNLFAEHLVNLVGYYKTGNGSTSSGLKELEKHWSSRFNTAGMHLNDGSGLSRSNAISAHHFTELLNSMKNGKKANLFTASLPVSGKSGTMRNICKGQIGDGRVMAKSGSMTRIKSYAGYIIGSSGKTYSFALIVNNQSCSSRLLVKKMEVLFNQIAIH